MFILVIVRDNFPFPNNKNEVDYIHLFSRRKYIQCFIFCELLFYNETVRYHETKDYYASYTIIFPCYNSM